MKEIKGAHRGTKNTKDLEEGGENKEGTRGRE